MWKDPFFSQQMMDVILRQLRNAIIHVYQGDEVYIRTHATNTGDFNIYSDTNGESLFARWLIEKDE
jgi:hypothetical protein